MRPRSPSFNWSNAHVLTRTHIAGIRGDVRCGDRRATRRLQTRPDPPDRPRLFQGNDTHSRQLAHSTVSTSTASVSESESSQEVSVVCHNVQCAFANTKFRHDFHSRLDVQSLTPRPPIHIANSISTILCAWWILIKKFKPVLLSELSVKPSVSNCLHIAVQISTAFFCTDPRRVLRPQLRAVVARAHGPLHPGPVAAAGVFARGAARDGARRRGGARQPVGPVQGEVLPAERHDRRRAGATHQREYMLYSSALPFPFTHRYLDCRNSQSNAKSSMANVQQTDKVAQP